MTLLPGDHDSRNLQAERDIYKYSSQDLAQTIQEQAQRIVELERQLASTQENHPAPEAGNQTACYLDELDAWNAGAQWMEERRRNLPGPWSIVESAALAKPGGTEGGILAWCGASCMLIIAVFRDAFNRSILVKAEHDLAQTEDEG